MLDSDDLRTIDAKFGIYDHDWRAYSPVLGEPHLVDDYLVYFDGVAAAVCAYRLGDTESELDGAGLTRLLDAADLRDARAVALWGRLVDTPAITLATPNGDRAMRRVKYADYDPATVDTVVDLGNFDYASEKHARKDAAHVRRRGIDVAVTTSEVLTADHLRLMDEWSANHEVSPWHSCLASAATSYIRAPAVYLLEARLDDRLLGFGILSRPAEDHSVLLQHFTTRAPGVPAGDAVYMAALELARELGTPFLHLGYSPTADLLRFKRKWGGRLDQPPFRDSWYTDDAELEPLIARDCGVFPLRAFTRATL
ncbi:MAG TPA: hypothetical protein VF712_06565 [Thermoleophilaceae bacterium]|jgi:hypothetical protein